MGLALMIFCCVLGAPLFVLGATPLLRVRKVPAGKSNPLRGLLAGLAFFALMFGVASLVVRLGMGTQEGAFVVMLWAFGWLAVGVGTSFSFGVLVARIPAGTPSAHPTSLALRALIPWPLCFVLFLLPWNDMNMAGMVIAFAMSGLVAPLGVALSASAARRSVERHGVEPAPVPQARLDASA
ncbi:MAG: hypothetical protein QM778_34650 [Myxococcales bacterium]